jgi:hypothetical protein
MAKIDKEVLIKNRFWIGLGVFGVLWLVAVIVVEASGDDSKKKAWSDAKTAIENAKQKGPKTEAYQAPWNAHGKKFREHKDVIWKQAWEQQANMYTWPEDMPVKPLYPDDPLGADDRIALNNRGRFRTDYGEQFTGLEDYVYPAELNGGFEAVFPKQRWNRGTAPTREEIWLAQEDFWVRREMMVIVRAALDATAWFREEKLDEKEKPSKEPPRQRRFRNANWELNLVFEKDKESTRWVISGKSTIKNINATHKTQSLANPATNKGLPFRLIQGGGSYLMRVAGEPLAFERESSLNPTKETYSVEPVDLKRPFFVEQVLDWDISPIRRIDALALGAHSHRTFIAGLKMREDLKALDAEQPVEEKGSGTGTGTGTGTASGGAGASGGAAGGMQMGGPSGGMQMGGPSGGMQMGMSKGMQVGMPGAGGNPTGAAGESKETLTRVNEIKRARYMHVTPQCRHLPIALKVIVDQAHIADLLAAVANSRLRVQITQVSLSHADNVQRGAAAPASGKTGPESGAPRPGGVMPPTVAGMTGSRPPTGMMVTPPNPGGAGSGSGAGFMAGGSGAMNPMMMMSSPFMSGRSFGRPPGDERITNPTAPGGGNSATKPQIQDTARLVELTVYGLASLYERFPPKQPKDAPKDAPAATTPKK